MKTLTPIGWSEGMFLKPHHFQQSDLYQDARLVYHLRTVNPFHWGVARMRVDVDALENMLFRVASCEVVMPDGMIVRFPQDALIEERSFQDEFPASAAQLDVYLTVRSLGPDGGGAERFARESETRRDVLMRDNPAVIEYLVPRADLLFAIGNAEERLAGTESVRIAQVRRTGRTSPRFELSPHYAPPAVSLHAAAPLVRTVTEVIERLSAASRTFGQFRRERGPEAMGYGVGDFEQLMARQMINQYAPALQHGLLNENLHPYLAYGLLAELQGALTSYFPDEEAAAFPPYDHADLAGCFGTVAEKIRRLLERLLPVHYLEFPLARDGFQFSTALDEAVFGRGTFWVLALQGGGGEDALRERLRSMAKVTSTADMPNLLKFADAGVPLRHLPQPPAEIPRYAGWSYFQLDVADSRWRRIKDGGSFAFHLQDAEGDVEARLFLILSERERKR